MLMNMMVDFQAMAAFSPRSSGSGFHFDVVLISMKFHSTAWPMALCSTVLPRCGARGLKECAPVASGSALVARRSRLEFLSSRLAPTVVRIR